MGVQVGLYTSLSSRSVFITVVTNQFGNSSGFVRVAGLSRASTVTCTSSGMLSFACKLTICICSQPTNHWTPDNPTNGLTSTQIPVDVQIHLCWCTTWCRHIATLLGGCWCLGHTFSLGSVGFPSDRHPSTFLGGTQFLFCAATAGAGR